MESSDKGDDAAASTTRQAAFADVQYGNDRVGNEESDKDNRDPVSRRDGYNSRIEQILYEHPELPIVITDAGKNIESGGNFITYTIRTGVCSSNCWIS